MRSSRHPRAAGVLLAGALLAAPAVVAAQDVPREVATATPPAAPATPATPAASTAPAPNGSASSAAAVVPGAGSIRMNGLIQAWYLSETASARSTFRLRRAELKLTGDLGPRVGWTLGIDAAKALAVSPTYVTVDGQRVVADESVNLASQMLQDASVTVRAGRALAVDVGQMKVPLSLVGLQSPSKLETVERPMFVADRARGGGYGDVRDVGVLARGSALGQVDYALGAFNGSGESQNGVDRNDQKSLAARVVLRALVPGLQLGGSGVYGGRPGADFARRDRAGAEAQYAAGPLTARAEYMAGVDGSTRRAGYYGQAAYRVRRGAELVARWDVWDPDARREGTAATARARELLGGATLTLGGGTGALQVDYAARSFRGDAAPATRQLLVNVQTSW